MDKKLLLIINDNNKVVPSANKTHYIIIDNIYKIDIEDYTCNYSIYYLVINDEKISFTSRDERDSMLKKVLKTIKSHFEIVELNFI